MANEGQYGATFLAADVCAQLAAAGLHPGQMRPRETRPVKNGRWYIVGATSPPVTRCGAGDLSVADLRTAGEVLGAGWALVVLPEDPFERPDDPPPTLTELAADATYVVLGGQIRIVDHLGVRNRAGSMYDSPGYRRAQTGRLIRIAKVRLPAVTPGELADRLAEMAR